jgi:hypothetical protein
MNLPWDSTKERQVISCTNIHSLTSNRCPAGVCWESRVIIWSTQVIIQSHYFNGHFTVILMVISLSWDIVIKSDLSQAFLRDIQAFWRDIVLRTFMDILHIVFTLITHEKSRPLFGTKRALFLFTLSWSTNQIVCHT